MSSVIILTAAEAEAVRGNSTPIAAIEPVALTDGRFMLGTEVLADPAHKAHWDVLTKLPQKDSDDPAFAPMLGPSDGMQF